jgi:hypothetical protein
MDTYFIIYINPQSTLSIFIEYHSVCPLRRNWDSPTPFLANECASPPPEPKSKRGGHTRLRVRGWGSPNSDDWRKGLALCLLCINPNVFFFFINADQNRDEKYKVFRFVWIDVVFSPWGEFCWLVVLMNHYWPKCFPLVQWGTFSPLPAMRNNAP